MRYKKITAIILSAIIAVSAVSFSGCDEEKNNNESSKSSNTESTAATDGSEISDADIMRIYQVYGSAGCIYLCERNSIALETDYKEDIAKEAKALISGLNLSGLGTSDLAKLICADNALSLGMDKRLRDELYLRYNEQAKLFDEYTNDDYKDIDDDVKTAMQMTSTDALWMQLNSFNLKDEKYDIKKLLADSFNANTDKYDHNRIYDNKLSVTSELENIFYYFLITDSLDEINYTTVSDVLGPNYLRDYFDSNEGNEQFKEFSIENISPMLTDVKAKEKLNIYIELKYPDIQAYFNRLKDESAFAYDKTSEDYFYYEYTLFTCLSLPKNLKLSENKFFSDNIGKWLKQCYNNNHKK